MSDFDKYSSLQPPTDPQERIEWLRTQEDRIALLVRRELVRLIDSSTEAFVNSLTATGDMSYFDQIPMQWNMWVDDVLLEEMQGMFLAGGLTAVTGTDGTLRIVESLADSWVEVVNENAVEYAKVAQNRMKDVGMTAWNDIKNKVSTSIEKGTSVEDLKTLIEKNRSFSEFRADTIARTETLNAYNNGNWEGSQALGEYGPTHKYWINTGDARSRETHNTVGSQPAIPVGQPFLVGGEEMMFPHSPGASAKNVVNCRCLFGELWPGDIDPNTGNVIGEPTIATTVELDADRSKEIAEDLRELRREGNPLLRRKQTLQDEMYSDGFYRRSQAYQSQVKAQHRQISAELKSIQDEAAELARERMDLLFKNLPDDDINVSRWQSVGLDQRVQITGSDIDSSRFIKARDRYVVADTPTLEMNAALRSGKPLDTAVSRRVSEANFMTKGTTTVDSIVSRTMELKPGEASKLQPGSIWESKGFQSTQTGSSSGYDRSDMTIGRVHVDAQIRLPAGTHAADVGSGEVVLRPGSMRVVSSVWDGQVLKVLLEWIS